jgi:hypothetical protein
VNHFEFRMVISANNGRASWGIQRHQGELLLAWLELYFGLCQGIHLDVLDQWLARDFTSACNSAFSPATSEATWYCTLQQLSLVSHVW